MENSPNYGVAFIAEAPANLSYETFCQKAVAITEAGSPDSVAFVSAHYYGATPGRHAHMNYTIQVWEMPKRGQSISNNRFLVQGKDPETCLHELGRELAALKAKLDYDAANAPATCEPTPATPEEDRLAKHPW